MEGLEGLEGLKRLWVRVRRVRGWVRVGRWRIGNTRRRRRVTWVWESGSFFNFHVVVVGRTGRSCHLLVVFLEGLGQLTNDLLVFILFLLGFRSARAFDRHAEDFCRVGRRGGLETSRTTS